jgi:putative FmdB family regulatory protein
MPLYEYQCDGKCGKRFEKIQKFSDPPVEKCPNCGGPCHKLLSSPAIQFKGSGWYITDYARKDSSPSGKSNGASTETKSSEKSEKTDKAGKPADKKPAAETAPSSSTDKK